MNFYTRKRGGNGVDLHSFLPKVDLTFPGMRYAGSGNPLQKQIQILKLRFYSETGQVDKSSIIINPGNDPTSELDTIALFHDCEYHFAERQAYPLQFKYLAVATMLLAMKNIKRPTHQKAMALIKKSSYGLKIKVWPLCSNFRCLK